MPFFKGPKHEPISSLQRQQTEWLVCFVEAKDKQWWHPLLWSRFKHCFLVRRDRENTWTLFEPWWSRILVATLSDQDAQPFLDWGHEGIIVKVKERVPGDSSQLRGWMSCAALVAHVLGRSYVVYTPAQLLKRLQREPETNYFFKGQTP